MSASNHIDPQALLEFSTSVYRRVGMPEEEARLAADTLVQADLWGHQSHGVMRLSWYGARLAAGVCDPAAKAKLVVDAGAIAVLDGHDGMGQVLTASAATEAITRTLSDLARLGRQWGVSLPFAAVANPLSPTVSRRRSSSS